MHREVRAGRWDVCAGRIDEAYRREFAQENRALTPKNTISWRKFVEAAET